MIAPVRLADKQQLGNASRFIQLKAGCIPHVVGKQAEADYAFSGRITH